MKPLFLLAKEVSKSYGKPYPHNKIFLEIPEIVFMGYLGQNGGRVKTTF